MPINKVYLADCMDIMRMMPDKSVDLCIVDPPYGLERMKHGSAKNNRTGYATGEWNNTKPSKKFFEELFRISKNQIIWGANNFTLPNTEYFIIWDKEQSVDNFASAEYAWTSCKQPAKVFRFSIHKIMAERRSYAKIHPTQKPVALYKWLLKNYAKPGDKIFDSHVGSGSIRIACHDMGFDFEGCEIDKGFWEAQEARYNQHIMQGDLFSGEDMQKAIYQEAFL